MTSYVPRTKQQRHQLNDNRPTPGYRRVVTLKGCGHDVHRMPELSNPDRWWCCGEFRSARP